MPDFLDRVVQRSGQLPGRGPVVLQQLKSHALRRLDAHPWQALEGLNQSGKSVGIGHGG
jgi:hypothetical protein